MKTKRNNQVHLILFWWIHAFNLYNEKYEKFVHGITQFVHGICKRCTVYRFMHFLLVFSLIFFIIKLLGTDKIVAHNNTHAHNTSVIENMRNYCQTGWWHQAKPKIHMNSFIIFNVLKTVIESYKDKRWTIFVLNFPSKKINFSLYSLSI